MHHRQDQGPELPAETAASMPAKLDILDAIRSYEYFVVAYAMPAPYRRVVWVVHAHPRTTNGGPVISEEITPTAGAAMLMYVIRNYLPHTGPEASLVPSQWSEPFGTVIESFSIDPYDVRTQVDFCWVGACLVVAALEADSFSRDWHLTH